MGLGLQVQRSELGHHELYEVRLHGRVRSEGRSRPLEARISQDSVLEEEQRSRTIH